jgi:heptosyltransferase-3
MQISKVAIICSETISDGLMMMCATHRLSSEGAFVITFNDKLHELTNWFPGYDFSRRLSADDVALYLESFDLVILQYDGSNYAKNVYKILSGKCKPILSVFYPTHSKYTHPPLTLYDRVFDSRLPTVDNVSLAISSLLQVRDHSKNNGLAAPSNLLHRRYKNRVAILASPRIRKKYEKIAEEVRKLGFDPIFVTEDNISLGASIIYESGYFIGPQSDLCHLASNLHIPTLVVSGKEPISLRKPGWLKSSFIIFPKWLPQMVSERFVFVSKVVSGFKKMAIKKEIKKIHF